ncbi:MAG: hypothetical protein JNK40_08170 [Chromatiales bacterium]|nr:hypothetical protein [Chromatiales bacterium]
MFAPHSRWRSQITPAGRGRGKAATATRTPAERHRAMTWAQRLKRVFQLDLATCEGCGGQVRVVACIEDPLVIAKILEHRDQRVGLPGHRSGGTRLRPGSRALREAGGVGEIRAAVGGLASAGAAPHR